ncbi:MAG: bifunctional pyr operon transcriptional regulator/uracil phosphoribosyltransferase PyrR [Sphingomonadales bacterium]|nr:bifunctional pyr operon transcriptional regulator/uracil phosphoribosyltransferase PyrR [Sphingomonadales bacterium]
MSTESRVIVQPTHLTLILQRLSEELLERHPGFHNTVLIGLQPRGVFFLNRLTTVLQARISGLSGEMAVVGDASDAGLNGDAHVNMPAQGALDVTFYRDDFRHRTEPLSAHATQLPFSLEGKKVVLVDDVLFTGRTIRAGLDALLDFGRPNRVELMVLVSRRFRQEFPIHPDYYGIEVNTHDDERVRVCWDEPDGAQITLIKSNG